MAWEDDILGRKDDALYLTNFLTNLYERTSGKKHHILNINAGWGGGKTYFLTNWKRDLEKNNPVVYYNAWENDYTSEPLLSFIAEIKDQISPFVKTEKEIAVKRFSESAKRLIKPLVPVVASFVTKQLTGVSIDAIGGFSDNAMSVGDELGEVSLKLAESALEEHNLKKKSISTFKQSLAEIVSSVDGPNVRAPIYIFVDELDRCRPTFAIELLESIKHLFGVEGIFFVIATDSLQLSHSIRSVYGEGFDSLKYLKRFFDREYQFVEPDYQSFVKYIMSSLSLKPNIFFPKVGDEEDSSYLMGQIFKFYRSKLRDVEQCLNSLQACSLTTDDSFVLHGIYLLHLICLKHHHFEFYDRGEIGGRKFSEYLRENGGRFLSDTGVYTHDRGEFGAFVQNRRLSIPDILDRYYSFLDLSIPDISSNANPATQIDAEVREQFISVLRSGWQTNNPPRHNLKEYPSMVDRAGRLT